MRGTVIALALAGLMVTGCRRNPMLSHGENRGYGGSEDITDLGLFGGANVDMKIYQTLCAGRAMLSSGTAEIKDSCFSGDTNVVICTDVTNVNPVRCTPARGSLSIGGSGSDVVAYARVR